MTLMKSLPNANLTRWLIDQSINEIGFLLISELQYIEYRNILIFLHILNKIWLRQIKVSSCEVITESHYRESRHVTNQSLVMCGFATHLLTNNLVRQIFTYSTIYNNLFIYPRHGSEHYTKFTFNGKKM